jgi:hypothetical protein
VVSILAFNYSHLENTEKEISAKVGGLGKNYYELGVIED